MHDPSFQTAASRFSRILCIFAVLFAFINARAQDVPHIISYQGQITTSDGIAMNGTHHITATLYSDHFGKTSVWQGTYDAAITNGIFNIVLGAGVSKLPDVAEMNRSLWVGISVDEGEEMQPLTQLSSVPYALNVPDQSITMAKLAPDVVLGTRNTPTPQHDPDDWALNGNTLGFDAWLGSKDNHAIEIHVYDTGSVSTSGRVMRFDGSNILAGYKLNTISGGTNVIGGGGYQQSTYPYTNHPNNIGSYGSSYYSFLGGGAGNELTAICGFLGGGVSNIEVGYYNAICGGNLNTIGTTTGVSPGSYSFIGTGLSDTITSEYSSIVGGAYNLISSTFDNADFSAILGGSYNRIFGTNSTILGGGGLTLGNRSIGFLGYDGINITVGDTTAYLGNVDLLLDNTDDVAKKLMLFSPGFGLGNYTSFEANTQFGNIRYILPAVIGSTNQVLTLGSVSGTVGTLGWQDATSLANAWNLPGNAGTTSIGDGGSNYLGTSDNKAFEIRINQNDANSNRGDKRVMRFEPNTSANTGPNIIGGYQGNNITGGVGSIICGGGSSGNENRDTADFSVIVGGAKNIIESWSGSNKYSFIGGGFGNTILGDEPPPPSDDAPRFATIVGGFNNTAIDSCSFIGGGANNNAQEEYSVVVAGKNNIAASYAGVVSGDSNQATSKYSFVGGGLNNQSQGQFSFIGSGDSNRAFNSGSVVSGGDNNVAQGNNSFLGGGSHNSITQPFSAIAAGLRNQVIGTNSFIGSGRSDSVSAGFSSIAGGDINKIISGANFSFIGGGQNNVVGNIGSFGLFSNILGGDHDSAGSYAQTVIGYFNKAQGTSMKPFSGTPNSINSFDRVFIVGAGQSALDSFGVNPARPEIRKNAFEVTNDGHAIVYARNDTVAISVNPAIKGATSVDNTCIAWGNQTSGNVTTSSFGVASAIWTVGNVGVCTIKLNYEYSDTDPNGTSPNQVNTIKGSAITVTTVYVPGVSTPCTGVQVEPITFNGTQYQFIVHTWSNGCTYTNEPFMFHVFARP